MGKIHILHPHLANQIAAGEVIERPSSVIKELVENAIDAKATRISIQAKEGGISYIRVSDNGLGMDKEDAKRSFSRHATSKIKQERDLFSIRTLGFRGEALPSIASVSKMTVVTAYDDDQVATMIRIEGGEFTKIEETSRPKGTDVEVRELFFNTPARLKYLKTIPTEIAHIVDMVGRLSLSHPHIRFSLHHNGKELFLSTGDGKLLHVLHALYGGYVSRNMIPIQGEDMDFSLNGFITKPEVTRSNRSYLSLILNGRHIRSHPLIHAILRGYTTLLPTGRFPVGAVSLSMDPKLVDVNVHPSKLEVRISKEKECGMLLEDVVKRALKKELLIPKAPLPEKPKNERVQPSLEWEIPQRENKVLYTNPSSPPLMVMEREPSMEVHLEDEIEKKEDHDEEIKDFPRMYPLAQVHGTYIVAQTQDGFFLIDQHAAHERIYYEVFLEKLGQKNTKLQELLVPLTLETSIGDKEIVHQYMETLHHWGLSLESFGGSTFLIRSYPTWFPENVQEIIYEILSYLKKNGKVDTKQLRDEAAKMMSCKKAIKANRRLRLEEMEQLLQDLKKCENPFTCPHGRPIYVHFSTYELEKMFKRVM